MGRTFAEFTLSAFALVVVLSWAGASPAFAVEVRDEAGFFKPETVTAANQVIKEIKQKYKKDLLVETFRRPSGDNASAATSPDREARQRFYTDWAIQRAREQRLNGIYVLITREPGHVEAVVGNQTRKYFSSAEREKLVQILVSHFKKKEFDAGLLAGVNHVRSALATKTAAGDVVTRPGPDGTGAGRSDRPADGNAGWSMWHWLGLGLAVLVGFWVIRALMRAASGSGARPGYGDYRRPDGAPVPGPGGYGGGGYGGGGFFSGLLGGLFGAAAGSWLYDRFLGGHGTPTSPAEQVPTYGSEPADTDYTASGGDFGDVERERRDYGGDFASAGDDFSSGGDFGGDFGGDDGSGGDF